MGENEQGGMLRTVVVIGIIAMIALIITLGVVGLKSNMASNSNKAVGAVATTKVQYGVVNPDVTYKKYITETSANWEWDKYTNLFPVVGDIPNNSWREDRLVVNSSERIYIRVDINDNPETRTSTTDNDDWYKRLLEVYDENGKQLISTNSVHNKVYLNKDRDYTLIVKYFNNSGQTFVERAGDDSWHRPTLDSGVDDGSPYRLKIKSFEAATYDAAYAN